MARNTKNYLYIYFKIQGNTVSSDIFIQIKQKIKNQLGKVKIKSEYIPRPHFKDSDEVSEL